MIEAGIELTLTAGGSFIKLDPGGITVSGPITKINAGGAPGKGSGISVKLPVLPGTAEKDKAGSLLEQARAGLLNPKKKVKRTMNFSG